MSRRLWFLGGAVAILAAYVFLWEVPRERARTSREAEASRLFTFDPSVVDTLRVERAEGSVVLVADGEHWQLAAPIQDEVEAQNAVGYLARLLDQRRERVLMTWTEAEDLAEFGVQSVANGAVRIEVVSGDGTRQAILVGRQTPSRQNSYVRREGEDSVELGPAELLTLAAVSHHSFRRTELWPVEREDIVWVKTTKGRERIDVVKTPQGLWHHRDQPTQWVRLHHMNTIVFRLASGRVVRYLEDETDAETWQRHGLDPPAGVVEFGTAAGEQFRVSFGNEAEAGEVYARHAVEATLFTVPTEMAESVSFSAAQLKDTNPIREVFPKLDGLVIRADTGASLGAARQGDDWVTLLPAEFSGDPENLITPLRNVLLGLERFQTTNQMIVGKTDDPTSALDRVPVRGQLTWGQRVVSFALGWRDGEVSHWFHLEGEPVLHEISRDLFLRLRGFLQAGQVL